MPEAEDAIARLTGQEIRGIPVKLELAPVSRQLPCHGLELMSRRALAVVVDTRVAAAAATKEEVEEEEEATAVEEDTKEVEVEATVVEGITSDELLLPETTTDEVEIPVDTLLDERSTEGMNPEGMITDGTIDLLGETMTVIGVLLEGTTEIGSMTETDRNEPLPPKPMDETRKYLWAWASTLILDRY
jgi:hypothetical protein